MLHSGQPARRRIFIGDIHGQYHKLAALLEHLDALYQPDERLLIFVGDLIDNQLGAQIDHLAVLERVSDGWTLLAHGICVYEDGSIEWDWSTWGHWPDGRPRKKEKHDV